MSRIKRGLLTRIKRGLLRIRIKRGLLRIRIKRGLLIGGIGLFLLIILVHASFWLLKSMSFFSLQEVKISGLSKVKEEEIKKLLPIFRGENLFRLDLSGLQKLLESHPWIRRAYITRSLPHTLEIRIEEEIPVAVINLSGKLYLLNEEGKAFSKASPEDLFSYPVLSFEDPNLLKKTDFLKLLSWIKKKAYYLPCYENISQVYLARDRILLITKSGLKVRFAPGPFEDLKRAYLRLDKVVNYLYQKRLYSKAEKVRLDYPQGQALLVYRRNK